MEDEIKVINFDDIMGTEDVASALGITYYQARLLMNQQVINCKRINGLITLRPIVEAYKNTESYKRFKSN